MIERLNKILDYYGLTPSEFADQIEVQRSSLSHIFSGRNNPSLDFVMKVKHQFPEISTDWMIFGDGEMIENSTPLPDEENVHTINFELDMTQDDFSEKNQHRQSSLHESKKENQNNNFVTSESSPDKTNSEEITASTSLYPTNEKKREIERIVFFYKNGKFEVYDNY
ncbi:hypothetical protein HMPREF2660_08215 [Weeksella sp. HMSC059D05]|nr:hypothetical protein HMPREF2660_08215 [Weeksella sp. HMSC059D05]